MKIRLGIIGSGLVFHKKHLPVLLSLKSKFEVRYIYSSNRTKFETAQQRLTSARHCAAVSDLLAKDDIDAVIVCVPIPLHGKIAAQILRAKKHLLIEKPLAANVKIGQAIVALAQRQKCKVMVAENFRYLPSFRRIKTMLASKELGRLLYVQVHALKKFDTDNPYYKTGWRVNPKGYPGILLDGGIHVISMLRFLFPKIKMQYRQLRSFNPKLGRYDTGLLHLKINKRVDGLLFMSYSLHNSDENFLKLYFEKGTIQANMSGLLVERGGHKEVIDCPARDYFEIYEDFYRYLTENKQPRYDAKAAYEDLQLYHQLFEKKN